MRAFALALDQRRGQIVAIEFKRMARRTRGFLTRFASATRGNVAMMFGLTLPVMVMLVAGGIDLHNASTVKAKLQDALDAAALAAARSRYTDDANINRVGLAALKANMKEFNDEIDTASFVLSDGSMVVATARINVKTLIANIILPPYGKLMDDRLPVSGRSEVLRASRNVEVALALDITGSMDNCTRNCPPTSKLQDLQAAAKELIDIVVQDQQEPFYSKVALAPYAAGVNVGSRANSARGSLDGTTRNVSSASWLTGTLRTISSISSGTVTVTSNGHGFVTGDRVVMWNVGRMPTMNGVTYQVVRTSNNQFQLRTVNSAGAVSNYLTSSTSTTNAAYVAKCARTDCGLVLNVTSHGLSTNDYVRLTDMGGLSQLNEGGYRVASVSGSQIILDTSRSIGLVDTSRGAISYTSGGKLMNGRDGSLWRAFPTDSGMVNTLASSNCVSERVGAQRYTDVRPSTASVGRSYLDSSNPCPSREITPLSSSASFLRAEVDRLRAGGSTAGQIGIAWAWYMVSPNFASLFDTASRPGAYEPDRLLKVAVLMTDGEFNTPFRDGVIASDAGTGSGSLDTHINLSASNGDPFTQSVDLCNAMKAQGVVVYTVGFDLGTNTGGPGIDSAVEVMKNCATDENTHFFNATTGTDLRDAFRAIGRDITRLRIAR